MKLTRTNRSEGSTTLARRAGSYVRAAGMFAAQVTAGPRPRPRPCPALQDESGQGVAEYVIILAVIVVAAIILAVAFHEQLAAVWQSVTSQLGDLA
ncbi:MAG: hypothetical protein FWF45_02425 [Coriobacteriia bacterium]|nr:hypothetical protein [Coriobacteriia bacterium]